ncbi:MAG: alpha-L-fucosidase [Clostridia bacterium]|nr:alpha-L-fucosidase [Clostridia bacterium]
MKTDSRLLASKAVPTARQLKWQEYGYYGMLSYGMNTMTGAEWGNGYAAPESFWPERLDTDEWARFAKEAGMSALVFTAKHFDGFCLWQTEMTDYSLKSCLNWREGKGDIVADLAASCRKVGLAFGIYVSPWDKHEKTYGTGKPYDDFFCGLLTELLTNYGDIFEIWLDCRVGTGVNGTVQDFDLDRYHELIRSLQPDCVIAGLGPDVRWNGSNRFSARKEEWSSVPERLYTGDKKLTFLTPDIGSAKAIKKDESFIWYPLEVGVPMRDGWFFNKDQNYSSKTKDKLWKLYLDSVGHNANFMLGICPDKQGNFHEVDVSILKNFAKDLKLHFGYNLIAERGRAEASGELSEVYGARNLTDKGDGFWMPPQDEKAPYIDLYFDEPELFDKLVMKENIRNGQRIESFEVLLPDKKGKMHTVYQGTTVGSCKICELETVKADRVRIVFTAFRDTPQIKYISLN